MEDHLLKTTAPRKWVFAGSLREHLLWLMVPVGFILMGFAALPIDGAVAQKCLKRDCPYVLTAAEPFGNGLGLVLVGVTIFLLDPAHRYALFRVIGCAGLSGLAANGLKLLLGRTRPSMFDLSQPILSSFLDHLPGTSGGYHGQSFPSAHTACVVAFAVGLAWLYPRGRAWFFFLGFLVVCQRVFTGSHFVSDVCWGASLGSLIALAFYKLGLLPGWMDTFEEWLKSKWNADSG